MRHVKEFSCNKTQHLQQLALTQKTLGACSVLQKQPVHAYTNRQGQLDHLPTCCNTNTHVINSERTALNLVSTHTHTHTYTPASALILTITSKHTHTQANTHTHQQAH